MLIEKNAQYYLKRTRAFAKEIEFDIPEHLRTKKEVDINELFPVVIGCIADLSADIVRDENIDKQVDIHKKELYFASKFYDSYINLRVTDISAEKNYFYLVGAIAYYLCDQIGSSIVLIKLIDRETLNLSKNELDILLYHLLKNDVEINDKEILNSCNSKYISEFINKYNRLMTHGLTLDFQFIKEFRQSIYDTNDCRDIFLIDALLAIFILKTKHSVFEMLPKYSYIELNDLVDIVNSGHFVRELWPSQRFMCEEGFFKGKSGVVQMPTGSGKTKAMSMAIYSAFCSESVRLSVVVAPFRALCREISTDLRHDLEFNNELHKIIYTLKNNNIDKILSNNIIDLITEYHMLILEDAPKRNNIPENNENRKTITEDKIINENVKKEKRSFFIKFLPTIIAVLGLLVAYIIYNAAF